MLEIERLKESGVKLTPMMAQYSEIKAKYRDHMLLFRMGDFYEVFFEDAVNASKILNIALTHRGKIGDTQIPMAGIPHHAAPTYIDRISKENVKVAICEQVEDPKEAKGIVKRAVTQIVTPGIPFDLDKSEANENQFILSAYLINELYYLTALDFTTGHFKGFILKDKESFLEKVRALSPKEFISSLGQWDGLEELGTLLKHYGTLVTNVSLEYFDPKFTEIYIEKLIPSFKRDQLLTENKEVLAPIGALSYYICSTQSLEDFIHIHPFSLISETGYMKVTIPTLTGLEILPKAKEYYSESLLGFMDKTKTALGSRSLKGIFTSPLMDKHMITARQDAIAYLLENDDILKEIREELNNVRDLERILAKVATGKVNAGDLLNTALAIQTYFNLKDKISSLPKEKNLNEKEEKQLAKLQKVIQDTLNDEIGANLDKGNLIKDGADKERDKLSRLAKNASGELLELESKLREETGILKLKIKSNNVAGYFIEVSKAHSDKVPPSFIRRQTLVNSERYVTEELAAFEKEVVLAKEKLLKLEKEIFKAIVNNVSKLRVEVRSLASILATLDIFQSLTWVARNEEFARPEISSAKKEVVLKDAWHPLIKNAIKDKFVCHDLTLNSKQYFGLITGPNMAGKTTVMREVAIVQLLTQIGSYVPAKSAKVSMCDFLFSRLGASDDILKGQSTFMVEMAETAEIMRHATDRSLIILDEVGRGTSTYDGLSIAWALVEHFIHETKSLCLFATHYHELIDLADSYKEAKNLTVETMNHGGNVQFLYRLIEKGASQSFGIYVAKLAGIPTNVLKRSQDILKTLEKNQNHSQGLIDCKRNDNNEQLDFFAVEKVHEVPNYLKEVEENLSEIDINNMTPIQAINKLQELKDQITFQ